MRRRTRLCGAGILGLAASSVFATPVSYTDSHGDFVLPTNNKARDIYSASIDNDATNLYITINQDPTSDQSVTSFNFGIGITTGSPTAGGDVGSNTTTHGNPYIRALSMDSSIGGMLDWIGLFPA